MTDKAKTKEPRSVQVQMTPETWAVVKQVRAHMEKILPGVSFSNGDVIRYALDLSMQSLPTD